MKHSQDAVDLVKNSRVLLTTVSTLWTENHKYIGYSHLIKVTDGLYDIEKLSKAKAEALLEKDLTLASKQLTNILTEDIPQNQFDALVSLIYDIGIKVFKSSSIPKLLLTGKTDELIALFRKWNKYKKAPKYQLIDARQKEIQLFNTGTFKRTRKRAAKG